MIIVALLSLINLICPLVAFQTIKINHQIRFTASSVIVTGKAKNCGASSLRAPKGILLKAVSSQRVLNIRLVKESETSPDKPRIRINLSKSKTKEENSTPGKYSVSVKILEKPTLKRALNDHQKKDTVFKLVARDRSTYLSKPEPVKSIKAINEDIDKTNLNPHDLVEDLPTHLNTSRDDIVASDNDKSEHWEEGSSGGRYRTIEPKQYGLAKRGNNMSSPYVISQQAMKEVRKEAEKIRNKVAIRASEEAGAEVDKMEKPMTNSYKVVTEPGDNSKQLKVNHIKKTCENFDSMLPETSIDQPKAVKQFSFLQRMNSRHSEKPLNGNLRSQNQEIKHSFRVDKDVDDIFYLESECPSKFDLTKKESSSPRNTDDTQISRFSKNNFSESVENNFQQIDDKNGCYDKLIVLSDKVVSKELEVNLPILNYVKTDTPEVSNEQSKSYPSEAVNQSQDFTRFSSLNSNITTVKFENTQVSDKSTAIHSTKLPEQKKLLSSSKKPVIKVKTAQEKLEHFSSKKSFGIAARVKKSSTTSVNIKQVSQKKVEENAIDLRKSLKPFGISPNSAQKTISEKDTQYAKSVAMNKYTIKNVTNTIDNTNSLQKAQQKKLKEDEQTSVNQIFSEHVKPTPLSTAATKNLISPSKRNYGIAARIKKPVHRTDHTEKPQAPMMRVDKPLTNPVRSQTTAVYGQNKRTSSYDPEKRNVEKKKPVQSSTDTSSTWKSRVHEAKQSNGSDVNSKISSKKQITTGRDNKEAAGVKHQYDFSQQSNNLSSQVLKFEQIRSPAELAKKSEELLRKQGLFRNKEPFLRLLLILIHEIVQARKKQNQNSAASF